MALSRETTLRIRDFLDNWLPPVIRDSKVVMVPLLWVVFRGEWREFARFKPRGFTMTEDEFSRTYAKTADVSKIQGCTDLNAKCVDEILAATVGESVLDAGCGRGYLAERLMSVAEDVTGCDIVLDPLLESTDRLRYVVGSVERLPFDDDEFDTVVSTHTLEHVQRLQQALAELRRVAKQRLIIVVPKERPYRYSFNLHLHFFPYPWSLQAMTGIVPGSRLRDLGDWFYVEDYAG